MQLGSCLLLDVRPWVHARAARHAVLVQREDAKPRVAVLDRPRDAHLLALEAAREPLVAHVADAVERELRREREREMSTGESEIFSKLSAPRQSS